MSGRGLASLAAGVLAVLAGTAWPQGAVGEAPAQPEATIRVTGSATAAVDPDRSLVQFGVDSQEVTARGALLANSRLMDSVVEAITAAGVDRSEISTTRFTIHPVYERRQSPEPGGYRQELTGYRVSNVVKVESEELERVASLIDAAVEAGANRVEKVSFGLSGETRSSVQQALIDAAVQDARRSADIALGALGHQVSGVRSVVLLDASSPAPVALESARMAFAADAPPVFEGEQQVQATVEVTFLIAPDGS